MSGRRDELLAKSVDYLKRHGLAHLSLRPLAAGIGSSARLLIFHFGSREGLIEAVLEEIRRRMQQSFALHLKAAGGRSSVILDFWNWATHRSNLGYVRLLFEAQILALQEPKQYARFLRHTSDSWVGAIAASLEPGRDNSVLATLYMAVVDGLLLEYLGTGDARRTGEALRLFHAVLTKPGANQGRKS